MGKKPEAHNTAMALGDSCHYDVLLIQEPSTNVYDGGQRCTTLTHTAYDTFVPVAHWEKNKPPRVATYVSRRGKLFADQLRPVETRDALWTRIGNYTIVNIYNAQRSPENDLQQAADLLRQWEPPSQCIIAGDFNAMHHSWQSNADTTNRGGIIADWMDEHELALLNQPDSPTRYNNTIDLAFSNIPLAEATVEDHLATSSDHNTLSIIIPRQPTIPNIPARRKVHDLERFITFVWDGISAIDTLIGLPREPEDTDRLDEVAEQLVQLVQDAVEISAKTTKRHAHQAPWWSDKCAAAHREFLAAMRSRDREAIDDARQALRKTVRKAKRTFWRITTSSLKEPKDIFRITRWRKGASQFREPPLEVNSVVYETQLDRAEALRRATLERRTAEDDIEDPWLEDAVASLVIPLTVTLEEAKHAATSTGNTSPGTDNITVDLLKASWPAIGDIVRWLYESCLQTGHHPLIFKSAEVVMIPKTGKRDLSKPKSWRPISLLSCLGKGLERLIARRIAYAAIQQRVLSSQQFGALPKRAAVDLVAALIHDIETALSAGKVATVATMDVQGAFDAILRNRLTLRLRQQGWSPPIARWAQSFMTGRSARIRLRETTTPSKPLNCGLPQGSPASPVLFMLYTQPICDVGTLQIPGLILQRIRGKFWPANRFGYADDTAMLRIGNTLEETTEQVENDIQALIAWGHDNAISFDYEKTEVMHFSRKKNTISPPVRHGDHLIEPKEALRWLGLWLDRKLTFKAHVTKWASTAGTVANILKSITGSSYGPSPAYARQAVKACVEPMLLYGLEAWFPGFTNQGKSTSTGYLADRMNRVYLKAIRAAIPAWKTTPLAALHRESGLPPITQLLESSRRRFAARLQSLDPLHPLAARLANPASNKPTRLQRTWALLPKAPRPELTPPIPPATFETPSKREAKEAFENWFLFLPQKDLTVFSDGSKTEDGVGYGYSIWRGGKEVAAGYGGLKSAEVFDAEAVGAIEGLQHALHFTTHRVPIHSCLDNTAVVRGFLGKPSESSQKAFLDFQRLAKEHGGVDIRWSPGHMGIEGNEAADAYAKLGCSSSPRDEPPTLANVKATSKAQSRTDFQQWWNNEMPEAYQPLELKAALGCPKELALPRAILHHLLAARTGHGDFAEYHERFNHQDAGANCSCGRRKNPHHIFYCRKVTRPKLQARPTMLASIHRAIGKEFETFTGLAKKATFFQDICPRY